MLSFVVPVDRATSPWLVLRVSDPSSAPDARAAGVYAQLGAAIAYASPFYLEPDNGPTPARRSRSIRTWMSLCPSTSSTPRERGRLAVREDVAHEYPHA